MAPIHCNIELCACARATPRFSGYFLCVFFLGGVRREAKRRVAILLVVVMMMAGGVGGLFHAYNKLSVDHDPIPRAEPNTPKKKPKVGAKGKQNTQDPKNDQNIAGRVRVAPVRRPRYLTRIDGLEGLPNNKTKRVYLRRLHCGSVARS